MPSPGQTSLALVALLSLSFTVVAGARPSGSPRTELPTSGPVIAGDVRPGEQIGAFGRRAAWIGTEAGTFEAWVYPHKMVRDLQLSFTFRGRTFTARELARTVEVRPEWTAITYGHEAFSVRAIVATPIDEPAALLLLEVDASFPLVVRVSFHIEMHPMWPAGLGGQYSFWDDELPGFVLGEGSGANAGLVASPAAVDPTEQPAHSLPDQPTSFDLHVDPEHGSGLIPVVVAGWTAAMDRPASASQMRELYRRLAADPLGVLERTAEHYRRLLSTVQVRTPDPDLDAALRWARVRLDQGLVCNPDLGCGLIAGLGGSGAGYRPGFGWFFGGDAFYNSWALAALGQHETVRTALELLARYQRDDGKIMHELSQGAGSLDWFGDYPYGYYHAETTPYFLDAVASHARATGDLEWARSMLPALRKALEYCLSTDTDGDGLMENTSAGLAAVEMGALRQAAVHQDIYLASVWTAAVRGLATLAARLGETELAARTATVAGLAQESLERLYWMPERGHHAFATLTDGSRLEDLTVWAALPGALGLASTESGLGTVEAIAGPAVTTDWGTRMLASTSDLYDPLVYNQGTVWPFLSGFAGLAAYRYGHSTYGETLLDGLVRLTVDHSRGAVHEVLSGDRYQPMGASVPQQLFSTSSLVTPFFRGLIGLQADWIEGRLELRPQLPWDWPGVAITGIPTPGGQLDVALRQSARRLEVELTLHGSDAPPRLVLAPGLPAGAANVRVESELVPPEVARSEVRGSRIFPVVDEIHWQSTEDGYRADASFTWDGGVRLRYEGPRAWAAGASRALRVVAERPRPDGSLQVTVAGRPTTEYRIRADEATLIEVLHTQGTTAPGAGPASTVRLTRVGAGEYSLALDGPADYVLAVLEARASKGAQ